MNTPTAQHNSSSQNESRYSLGEKAAIGLIGVLAVGGLGFAVRQQHTEDQYPKRAVPAEWTMDNNITIPETHIAPEVNLNDLEPLSPEVKERATKNIVRINWDDKEGVSHQASGFYIGGNTIITAGHVVKNGIKDSGSQKNMKLTAGTEHAGIDLSEIFYEQIPGTKTGSGSDTSRDIAVIRFDPKTEFGKQLKKSDGLLPSTYVDTGDQAWAVNFQDGHAKPQIVPMLVGGGVGDARLSRDTPSRRVLMVGIDNKDHDALLSGGSGGVVINNKGEVLGMTVQSSDLVPMSTPEDAVASFGVKITGEPKDGWPQFASSKPGPTMALMEVFPGGTIDDALLAAADSL